MSREADQTVFYTLLQRRLHWLVILLLAGQYLSQGPMRAALEAIEREQTLGFAQFLVTTLHTWSGISVAAIMFWRWQLRKRQVPLNGGQLGLRAQQWIKIHHVCLYVTVWVMAITGAAHYYLGWHWAAQWHGLGKWLLSVLILAHIAGALLHAARGHTVLHRMMGKNSLR